MSKVDFPPLKEENNIIYLSKGNLSVEDIVDFIAEGGLEATFRYNDQDCKFVLANNPEEHYLDIEGEWFRKLSFNQFAEAKKQKTSGSFDCSYRYDLWLSPDKIFVSREEAERFVKFGPRKEDATQFRTPQKIVQEGRNRGGRPPVLLTEAITYAYQALLDQGNTEVLRKGNLTGFLTSLNHMITEGDPMFSDFVAERIKRVKPESPDGCIETQDREIKKGIIQKSKSYPKKKISYTLSNARKKLQK